MTEVFVAIGFISVIAGFIVSVWSCLIVYGVIQEPVNEVVAAYVWHLGALGAAVAVFGLFTLKGSGVDVDFFGL